MPPALPQLIAIDDGALSARHVVKDAALDKRVYARAAEQDESRFHDWFVRIDEPVRSHPQRLNRYKIMRRLAGPHRNDRGR